MVKLNYAKANAEHLKPIEKMTQVYNHIVHTTQRLTKTEAAAELAANQARRDSVKAVSDLAITIAAASNEIMHFRSSLSNAEQEVATLGEADA